MSQVFSADAVQFTNAQTITLNNALSLGATRFLSPPFGNAKAVVSGTVNISVGAGTTSYSIYVARNPNAESLFVAGTGNINVTPGNQVVLNFQAVDVIPDGRAVQYALIIQPAGATGNGSVSLAVISVMLLSG